MVGIVKKIVQFGVFINLRDNLQGSKCDGGWIFLLEPFPFSENVPSPLDPIGFFFEIF